MKAQGKRQFEQNAPSKVDRLQTEVNQLRERDAFRQQEYNQLKADYDMLIAGVMEVSRMQEETLDDHLNIMGDLSGCEANLLYLMNRIDMLATLGEDEALIEGLGVYGPNLLNAYNHYIEVIDGHGLNRIEILGTRKDMIEERTGVILKILDIDTDTSFDGIAALREIAHRSDPHLANIYDVVQRQRQEAIEQAAERTRQEINQNRVTDRNRDIRKIKGWAKWAIQQAMSRPVYKNNKTGAANSVWDELYRVGLNSLNSERLAVFKYLSNDETCREPYAYMKQRAGEIMKEDIEPVEWTTIEEQGQI
ncbi:MAG: hypothetical protein ABI947_14445 [Chloroflexota bacterium]